MAITQRVEHRRTRDPIFPASWSTLPAAGGYRIRRSHQRPPGRFNIGTLHQQGDTDTVAASDLLISRVSANVLEDSQVGFIFTDGDPTSNLDNRVAGADFQYINNRLPNGRRLQSTVFFQQSDTSAFLVMMILWHWCGYPSSIGFRSHWLQGRRGKLQPCHGFRQQRGIEDFTADLGYTYFFNSGIFQTAFAGVDMQRIELLEGGLQTEVVNYRLLELETNQRDRLQFDITNKEVVLNRFPIFRRGRSIH